MPSTSGFSTAVSRFFREAFHRRDKDENALLLDGPATTILSADNCAVPKHIRLPSGLARQVRHLVEEVTTLVKQDTPSRPRRRLRHLAAALKTVGRILTLEDTEREGARTKTTPLAVALDHYLTIWECLLQCLEAIKKWTDHDDNSRHSSSSSSSSGDGRNSGSSGSSSSGAVDAAMIRLQHEATTLLKVIVQQRTIDLALIALGNGVCNVHQHDGQRKRSIHEGCARPERDQIRVNIRDSRRSSISSFRKPVVRPIVLTKPDVKAGDQPICKHIHRYLDLHQTTLRSLLASASQSANQCPDDWVEPMEHTLLVHLLSASYIRIPALRTSVITAFKTHVQLQQQQRRRNHQRQRRSSRPRRLSRALRSRSTTLAEEINAALFRWPHNLSTKCHGLIVPYSREEHWGAEARAIARLLASGSFQRLFVAQLISYFMKSSRGSIDWKCLPGMTTLKQMALTMTEDVFKVQLRALEPSATEHDGQEGSALRQEGLERQSFTLAACDDPTIELFLEQMMVMMNSHRAFIQDWMLTIFQNTNYMIPHHVKLCLQYLGQLLKRFPDYFHDDPAMAGSTTPAVDNALLRRVFATLMRSEHFQILKTTELFLLATFTQFSMELREELVTIFASEFQRLFLHWHRDVRFCFFHILLYLTYPGNRLVLGAKSDEMLMGADAARLFEIPGLVRTSSSAKWDDFDEPLCELLAHFNRTQRRTTKRAPAAKQIRASMVSRPSSSRMHLAPRASMPCRPVSMPMTSRQSVQQRPAPTLTMPAPPTPKWIEALAFSTIQRSVQEYRPLVQTYYETATRISVHEPVPTPAFQVKG